MTAIIAVCRPATVTHSYTRVTIVGDFRKRKKTRAA